MWRHPARWVALGFGSGLSPWAPGTVGTLWAWAAWLVISPWLDDLGAAALILAALGLGAWACTRTARELAVADPSAIVWDEVVAFWLVLWFVLPAGLVAQTAAFALFRFFDAVKPGPVGWADRAFKGRPGEPIGWRQGVGILFDDLVAAGCTLLVYAVGVRVWAA
jgi:phosphatidylglycerophosphatase A